MVTVLTSKNIDLYERRFNEVADKLDKKYSKKYSSSNSDYLEFPEDIKNYLLYTDENGHKRAKIDSIEEYFGIMKYVASDINGIGLNEPRYAILPLDEDPIIIEENTRKIKFPNNFGVNVQGDESAEIIYFKIHRFFDATDLKEQDIYIQWELPVSHTKGLSVPWIVDYESEPGYLIFGWVISKNLTNEIGNVKFSVRFYKLNEDTTIQYSFNTLTALLPIKESIDLNIIDTENLKIENNTAESVTKRFVLSQVYGQEPVISPEIDYISFENMKKYYLRDSSGEELKLSIKYDGIGDISYSWYRKNTLNGDAQQITSNIKGTEYVQIEDGEIFNPNKKYYYKLDETYYEFTGTEFSSEETYYEKFNSSCLITEPGYYYCAIKRVVNYREAFSTTGIAIYPKPDKIELKDSVLETEVYGYSNNSNNEDFILEAPTNEDLVSQLNDGSGNIIYKWYKDNSLILNEDRTEYSQNTYSLNRKNDSNNFGNYSVKLINRVNNENSQETNKDTKSWNIINAGSLESIEYVLYDTISQNNINKVDNESSCPTVIAGHKLKIILNDFGENAEYQLIISRRPRSADSWDGNNSTIILNQKLISSETELDGSKFTQISNYYKFNVVKKVGKLLDVSNNISTLYTPDSISIIEIIQ